MILLLLAVAGGLGASIRFVVEDATTRRLGSRLPWALFLINGTGSFALGLLTALDPSQEVVLVVGVGLLGGYTTLSAASLATARLSLRRDTTGLLLSSLGMLALCLAGVALGQALG